MFKGMMKPLYYHPNDVDLEKAESSQGGRSLDVESTQTQHPFLFRRNVASSSHQAIITTLSPPNPAPVSSRKRLTTLTHQSIQRAEIPETQAVIVSQSKREQKRPAAPPESSNASLGITYPLNDHPDEHLEYEDKVPKRVNDTSVEETPDDLTEYEDNVGYGVRSKVRVRIWEPAKVERLKTDFVKMANELKTVSQERASLQQTVNDMSKQLDESIQVHEAMKRELEEIERRAKKELEEVKRRAKEDLDLEQWEENDVALELARQEIKHAVDERIKAERAHDAAIQDALAAREEARRAKILVGMHEQAVSEQVAKHKVEVDQRIRGLQESHEKQLNELRKSSEESMQEVLERYRLVLREEIFKGLGVESEAAMKEAIQQNSRRVAEAEQAQQELQQCVKDREKRLEIEVQNVKVSSSPGGTVEMSWE
ncbi:hypothetical protein BYT27DRAFT_7210204 [Phlegmacium glaucopus]|nr:hypothetical protein BYT27DRAFT_7210204 [Phlegmacium glaucopus]